MDYVAWKFWIDAAQLIGLFALGVYTWWTNNKKNNRKRFAQLDSRIDDIEVSVRDIGHSVDEVDRTVASRPPCLHHSEFDKRLRDVQSGVDQIDGRMVGVGNSLDNIQNYLMNNGG